VSHSSLVEAHQHVDTSVMSHSTLVEAHQHVDTSVMSRSRHQRGHVRGICYMT